MTTITIPEIAPNLHIWRSLVLARDNFTCQHCGNTDITILKAHHIIPIHKDEKPKLTISNGITLCVKCHGREHRQYIPEPIDPNIPCPHIKTLTEVRRNAGRKGGLISTALHPRNKEYLSQIGKTGGRPRRPTIEELMNGNGNNGHHNGN
jgi:general stress protein YciG